ncbi:hypothetical protein [Marivita hallyeonensis]|uniref:Uncharacterized protein n=1 Tax=Marivita hallyeonensis TaxID=996342 RepID=A0A1M5Y8W8_9RHOB|nr:hypothetical protein [Marivita hallyeonensis]SHI08379.1 hypothetical protein SAMN05443551_0157 [Marivita hallyeonensis]
MSEDDGKDPLEGFHFDDFDEDTKTLSIRVHKYVLDHPDQKDALLTKVAEILEFGDEIDQVKVTKR